MLRRKAMRNRSMNRASTERIGARHIDVFDVASEARQQILAEAKRRATGDLANVRQWFGEASLNDRSATTRLDGEQANASV